MDKMEEDDYATSGVKKANPYQSVSSQPLINTELERLQKELQNAKNNMEEWSNLVKTAVIGSDDEAKAEKQQAHYERRVTALEAQIKEEKDRLQGALFLSC